MESREARLTFRIIGGEIHEHADAPHRAGLLRARRERPRSRRAAEQRDELAALDLRAHSITSSARASSVGGTAKPSAWAVIRLITRSNLVGLLDRDLRGLGATQDLIDEVGGAAMQVRQVRAIGD